MKKTQKSALLYNSFKSLMNL